MKKMNRFIAMVMSVLIIFTGVDITALAGMVSEGNAITGGPQRNEEPGDEALLGEDEEPGELIPVVSYAEGLSIEVKVEAEDTSILPADTVVTATELEVVSDGEAVGKIEASGEKDIFYESLLTTEAAVLSVADSGAEIVVPEAVQEKDRELPMETLEEIANAEEELTFSTMISVPLDITLTKDGEEIQPEGVVKVSIGIPVGMDGENAAVYHVEENGNLVKMEGEVIDGSFVFSTNHFSRYTLVSTTTTSGTQLTASTGRSTPYSLSGGTVYYISANVTISGAAGISAMKVSAESSSNPAVIFIPENTTLTVVGGAASATTGAGAGIELSSGNYLYIRGGGTLTVSGGAASASASGSGGSNSGFYEDYYYVNGEKYDMTLGGGGAGGRGGGGGGAGIGGRGGNGGGGGTSFDINLYCDPKPADFMYTYQKSDSRGHELFAGASGGGGGGGSSMGTLYVLDRVTVNASGGSGGAAGSNSTSKGAKANDQGSGYHNNYYAGSSGAGGGGGLSGRGAAIGGGGGGAGGGGAGGQGSSWYSGGNYFDSSDYGSGGNGGGGGSGTGGSGTSFSADGYTYRAAPGGNGGANGSGGSAGTVYRSSDATINKTSGNSTGGGNGAEAAPSSVGTGYNSRYILTFNKNKPTSASGSVTFSTATINSQYLVALPASSYVPTLAGYTFKGWYTGATNGTQLINQNGYFNASVSGYTDSGKKWLKMDDVTLYAQWEVNKYTFKTNITHLNMQITSGSEATSKETSSEVKVTHDTNLVGTLTPIGGYNLPGTITVRSSASDGGPTTLTAGTHYTYNSTTGAITIRGEYILGNITIVAAAPERTKEFTLYTVGGAMPAGSGYGGANYIFKKNIGAAEALPIPVMRDKNGTICNTISFAGWYTNPSYSGTAVTSVSEQTQNTAYYAKWTYNATKENNGYMQYDYTKSSYKAVNGVYTGSIDVQGYRTSSSGSSNSNNWWKELFGGGKKQSSTGGTLVRTTYSDRGYSLIYKIGALPTGTSASYGGSSVKLVTKTGEDIFARMGNTDLYVAQMATFNGTYTTVTYILQNRGSSPVSDVSLGVAADVMINKNDSAATEKVEKSGSLYLGMREGNKSDSKVFRLYLRGASHGITDVDRYWIGYYENNKNKGLYIDNAFNSGEEWKKGDSALAFSWTRNIGAGETMTFSYKLGVGDAEELDMPSISFSSGEGVFEDGSYVKTIAAPSGESFIPAEVFGGEPEREGYDFLGWSETENADAPQYGHNDSIVVSEDTTIHAVWKSISFAVVNNSVVQSTNSSNVTSNVAAGTASVVISYGNNQTIAQGSRKADLINNTADFEAVLSTQSANAGDYLLPQTITVKAGGVILSEGTGYSYTTWNNQQSADLVIYAEHILGDVEIIATGHPAPAVKPIINSVTGDQTLIYGYNTADIKLASVTLETGNHSYAYQWYVNDKNQNYGGRAITESDGYTGYNSSNMYIKTGLLAGTYYYYCVVTATRTNKQVAVVNSSCITVTVDRSPVSAITYSEIAKDNAETGDPILAVAQVSGISGGSVPTGGIMFYYKSGEDYEVRDESDRIVADFGYSAPLYEANIDLDTLTQQIILYSFADIVKIYVDDEGKESIEETDTYYLLKYEKQDYDKLANVLNTTAYTGTLASVEYHYIQEDGEKQVEYYNKWVVSSWEDPSLTILGDTYTIGSTTGQFSVDFAPISTKLTTANFYRTPAANDSFAMYITYENVQSHSTYAAYCSNPNGDYEDGKSSERKKTAYLLSYEIGTEDEEAHGSVHSQYFYGGREADVSTGKAATHKSTVVDFERPNYNLAGWSDDGSTTVKYDLNYDFFTVSKETVLTAVWEGEAHGINKPGDDGITYTDDGKGANYGRDYQADIDQKPGYTITELVVKIGDTVLTEDTGDKEGGYTYDESTGELVIKGDYITDDITIEVTVIKTPAASITAGGVTANGTQESEAELIYGYSAGTAYLSVDPVLDTEADPDDYIITCQWYSNTSESSISGTKIGGAVSKDYTIGAGLDVGTRYYYCVVTAERKDNGQTSFDTSGFGSATVEKAAVLGATVSAADWYYGQTGNVPQPVLGGYSGSADVTYFYNTTGTNETGAGWTQISSTTALSAGTYYVYASIAETSSTYSAKTEVFEFKVKKAALASPGVSIAGWGYGDTANEPSVSGNTGSGSVTYYYSADNGANWTQWTSETDAPKKAGNYLVKAVIQESTNYSGAIVTGSFTIDKADRSVGVSVSDWQYSDIANSPSVTGNTDPDAGDGIDDVGTVTYYYSADNGANWAEWKPGENDPSDAGNYLVKAAISATENYNGAVAVGNFKITQASITEMELPGTDGTESATISVSGWTYGDAPQDPQVTVPTAVAGDNDIDNEISYYYIAKEGTTYPDDPGSVTAGGLTDAGWSQWSGLTTSTPAGDYYIIAIFEGTLNYSPAVIHKDSGGDSAEFTIAKAVLTGAEVSMNSWTYGGEAASPEVMAEGSSYPGTVSYTYEGVNQTTYTASETKPEGAGDYTVKAVFTYSDNHEETTVYDSFTIRKADLTATVSVSDKTYDTTAVTPSLTVKQGNNTLSSTEYGTVSYTYYTDAAYTTKTGAACGAASEGGAPINAGTYYVTASIGAGSNYNASSANGSFVISKVPISAEVSIANWVFAATPGTPSVSVTDTSGNTDFTETEYGTVTYSWTKGSTWTPWADSTPTEVADYTLKAVISGTGNYEGATVTGSFAITQANLSASTYIQIEDWTYGGTSVTPALNDNPGKGAVTWYYSEDGSTWSKWGTTNEAGSFSVGEGDIPPQNAGNYYIKAEVAAGGAYQAATVITDSTGEAAEFTIEKADAGTLVLSGLDGWSYGEAPDEPSLTGNNSDGDVTYWFKKSGDEEWKQWIEGVCVPEEVGTYDVKVLVEGTRNFEEKEKTFPGAFSLSKAPLNATVTLEDWIYEERANTPVVGGNMGSASVTYYYKEAGAADTAYTTTVPAAAGSYQIRAVISETACYESAAVTNTFSIKKGTLLGQAAVSVESFIYGQTRTPGVTVNGNTYEGTVDYYYGATEAAATNAWSGVNTANAAVYVIKAVIAETENYQETTVYGFFTVSKATLSSVVSISDWTYGEGEERPTLSANPEASTVSWAYSTDGSNFSPWGTSDGSSAVTITGAAPAAVGSYRLKAVVSGSANYLESILYGEFLIGKAAFSDAATTVNSWVYGETPETPATTGNGTGDEGVSITYYYSDDGQNFKEWSELTEDTPAGSYQIKTVIDGGDNYEDKEIYGEFTILRRNLSEDGRLIICDWIYGDAASQPYVLEEAEGTVEVPADAISYTYAGTANDGTTYKDSSTAPSDAGEYTVTATLSGSYDGTLTTEFRIEKKSISFSVDAKDITFGASEDITSYAEGSSYQVTGGTYGDVTYEYTGTTNDQTEYSSQDAPTAVGSYMVKAVLSGDSNHGSAEAYDSFIIEKAALGSLEVLADSWNYNGRVNSPLTPVSVTGNTGSGEITYYYYKRSGSEEPESVSAEDWKVWTSGVNNPIDVGSYFVKAEAAETESYLGGWAANSFAITKADSGAAVSILDWAYGQTASLPVVSNNVSNGNVAYTYYLGDGVTLTTPVNSGAATNGGRPANAGSYVLKAVVAGNSNYNQATAYDSFRIKKGDRISSSHKVDVDGWVYGQYSQASNVPGVQGDSELLTLNSNGDVKYYYSSDYGTAGDNAVWSAWNTSVMGTLSAGNYYIKAEVPASANYNGVNLYNTFTVLKATIMQIDSKDGVNQATIKAESFTYGGYSHSTNYPQITITGENASSVKTELSGHITYYYRIPGSGEKGWVEWTDTRHPSDAGNYDIKAVISGSANYADTTIDKDTDGNPATIIVAKAKLTNVAVVQQDWVLGEDATIPYVTGNSGSGKTEYKYFLTDGTTATTENNSGAEGENKIPSGAGAYVISANISESANYMGTIAYSTFTVEKIGLSQDNSYISMEGWNYGDEPKKPLPIVEDANGNSVAEKDFGSLSYYYGDTADGPWYSWTPGVNDPVDVGEYYVKVIIDEADSYFGITLTQDQDGNPAKFTIQKTTPRITLGKLDQSQNAAGNGVEDVTAAIEPSQGDLVLHVEYLVEGTWGTTLPQTAGNYMVRAYLTGTDKNRNATFDGIPNATGSDIQPGMTYGTLKIAAYVPPALPDDGKDKDKDKDKDQDIDQDKDKDKDTDKDTDKDKDKGTDKGTDQNHNQKTEDNTSLEEEIPDAAVSLPTGYRPKDKNKEKEEGSREEEGGNQTEGEKPPTDPDNKAASELMDELLHQALEEGLITIITEGSGGIEGNSVVLSNEKEILLEVLSEEELQAVLSGENITLRVEISNISERMEEGKLKAVEKNLPAGSSVGVCIDISLYKKLGEGTEEKVTRLNTLLQISLEVPEELRPEEGKTRTYHIMRIYEDAEGNILAEIVASSSEGYALSLQADLTSDYVIIYEEAEGISGHKPCGLCGFCCQPLGICIFIWILIALIIIGITFYIITRKKKEEEGIEETGKTEGTA